MLPSDLEALILNDALYYPRGDSAEISALLDEFQIDQSSPIAKFLKAHVLQFAGSGNSERIGSEQLVDPLGPDRTAAWIKDIYSLGPGQISLTTDEGEGIVYYDSHTDQVRLRLLPDISGNSDEILSQGFYDFLREYLG